jgi:anti-sigma regulatory factor (Ser/Thr protein kinase)
VHNPYSVEVNRSHQRVVVVEASQPSAARFAAQEAAAATSFSQEDEHRAGLIATELATNLVKHATAGEVLVRGASSDAEGELELIAIDRGPGIAEIGRALGDGYSTSGSPGTGLGAVRRMADEFDIFSQVGRGTVVVARLRAKRARHPAAKRLAIAGVSVAQAGEEVCGDAWLVHDRVDGALVIVADGLGHGLQANEASTAAVAAVDPRRDGNLGDQLQTMHGALRHTRGAAAAIAEIRVNARQVKYAGVGNISALIHRPGVTRRAVSLNGTLGHEARAFREYAYPWEQDAVFVMYSDGLASHWSLDDYPGLWQRHPALVAAVLYRDFSRQRDDVTVVVGRENA